MLETSVLSVRAIKNDSIFWGGRSRSLLILHQMLTFEGGLNLLKIEPVGFFTVTLHQLKR